MEEGESTQILSRKELRKQKLMEYLAAKGKLKPPAVTSSLHPDCQGPKPVKSSLKAATGKENKPSANKIRCKGSKSRPLTSPSSQDPLRRTFDVFNAANGGALRGKESAARPSSISASMQPRRNQNPLLTKTYSVVVSKPTVTAAGTLKRSTSTRGHASGKTSSDATYTVAAKSYCKPSLSSNCAATRTADSRISTGPLVKTKTGLTPAVVQPRSTRSDALRSCTTAGKTVHAAPVVAQKVPSSSSRPPGSVPQRPAGTVPLTSRAGGKVQAQNKPNPPLEKRALPACKGPFSGGPRNTSTSLKSNAPAVKPEGKALTSKSAGQSANRSLKATSGAAPQTSSRTNGFSSTSGSRFQRTAGTEPAGKTKTVEEALRQKKTSSAKILPPLAPTRRPFAPAKSQTAPRPSRTVGITGTKTPKVTAKVVPQTEGKKTTSAQEERLKKLKEWREAKGISYKRPPMQVKTPVRCTVSVPHPFWASMKTEDEARSLIYAVDKSLADCVKLLAEGCPPDQVKQIVSRLPPVSQKFAKYWICRARLMEREGNRDVLPVFEEAVRVVLEPVDELRTVVFDILKKKDESQEDEKQEAPAENTPDGVNDPLMTPKPVRALINGERGGSSVIKYKITSTPGGPPSQQRGPVRVCGQEVRFFTPVRRSARIERASLRYPPALQDHDVCVSSYSDLIAEEEDKDRSDERQSGGDVSPPDDDTLMYVYRENEALGDKVSVQLVCDDTV